MINSILTLLVPIIQIFLLYKIWREQRIISQVDEQRRELKETVKKFGIMFAEASGEKSGKKKVVTFEAAADE